MSRRGRVLGRRQRLRRRHARPPLQLLQARLHAASGQRGLRGVHRPDAEPAAHLRRGPRPDDVHWLDGPIEDHRRHATWGGEVHHREDCLQLCLLCKYINEVLEFRHRRQVELGAGDVWGFDERPHGDYVLEVPRRERWKGFRTHCHCVGAHCDSRELPHCVVSDDLPLYRVSLEAEAGPQRLARGHDAHLPGHRLRPAPRGDQGLREVLHELPVRGGLAPGGKLGDSLLRRSAHSVGNAELQWDIDLVARSAVCLLLRPAEES
mmetsp:Transcript_53877/g.157155  ORF Transcript_53877/g.157155 Transcript_53877/m.157155 type:complete len:264 (+) Transcript_53877:272-1063(+)